MPHFAADPVTRLAFSVQQNPGVYALLLGSGLSCSAGIPTGWDITLDLVRKVARADDVSDQADWYAWYKATYGQDPDYSHLLERLAPNPAERQPIIQAYLEPARNQDDPNDRAGLPTRAHQAIARLVKDGYVQVIITTNFDRLLETALTEVGIQPTIIATPDQCNGAVPLPHSRCTILKLHGDVLDVRSLNTDAELATYPPEIDQRLDRILDEYGLIVCGWSGVWDHALRAAILRARNRRYSTWWTAIGDLKPEAAALADHRKADHITITGANEFFRDLANKVDTIARLNQSPPATVELLVTRTKRYLPRAEHWIDLADLVTAEADRLIASFTDSGFDPHAVYSPEELIARRDRYENLSEPLACVLSVLGRWGCEDASNTHERLAHETIARVYLAAKAAGQLNGFYPNLQTYPVLLLFHAYGAALTHGQHWKALKRFFELPVGRHVNSRRPLVELMLLYWWEALVDRDDFVVHLTGRPADSHATPVTDHVWQRIQPWLRHYAGDVADRDMLHARFLVYGSFAHFCVQDIRSTPAHGQVRFSSDRYKQSGVDMAVPILPREQHNALLDELYASTADGRGFAPEDRLLIEAFLANLRGKVRLEH